MSHQSVKGITGNPAGWPVAVAFVPLALMALVAALHFVRVRTVSLSPWKGGGFAMFSTADTVGNRFVKVNAMFSPKSGGPSVTLPVTIPSERPVQRAERRAQAQPTHELALELAGELSVLGWYLVDPSATPDLVGADADRAEPGPDRPGPAHQVMALQPEQAKLLGAKRVYPEALTVDVRRILWDWTAPKLSSESIVTVKLPMILAEK